MKIVKIKFIVLLILFSANSQAEVSSSTSCKGITGLQVMTDFDSNSKPFIRKTPTPLYTSYSDDTYFTHIAVEESKFKPNQNVEITLELLNKQDKTISKFVLNQWISDKDVPNMKLSKISILKVLQSKLIKPFDNFINLSKSQRSRIDSSKIPYNSKFHIGYKNSKPFCSFDFKYASEFHEH